MLKEVQFFKNAKITDTYVFSIAIFTYLYENKQMQCFLLKLALEKN